MLLYHGSNIEIKKINLEKCRPFKDFGRGFYLTTIEEQAALMARRTSKIFSGIPFVTTYEFDGSILRDANLSIKIFDEPSVEWAMFVLNNRNRNFSDITDKSCNQDNKYDIVVGAVANDDIALLFRTFSNGYIGLDALVKGMKYKQLNDQYSFHTKKAISYLTKVGAKKYE